MRRLLFAVALIAGLIACSSAVRAADSADAAFLAFWNAPTAAAAEKTIHGIIDSGVSFDAALIKLKTGRAYAKEKTGLVRHPASVRRPLFHRRQRHQRGHVAVDGPARV